MGEWLLRADALCHPDAGAPTLLVAGDARDRPQDLEAAGFVGLGCWAKFHRRGVTLSACLQDVDTGRVSMMERDFPDPADGPPRGLPELARASVVKGAGLAAVGAGRLVIASGRRSASLRLVPGRRAVVNPQGNRRGRRGVHHSGPPGAAGAGTDLTGGGCG
jgi:hypothetical protein